MTLLRILPAALLFSSLALPQVNSNADLDQAPDERVLPMSISSPDQNTALSYSNLRIRLFPRTDGNSRQSSQLPLDGKNSFLSAYGATSSTEGVGVSVPESTASVPGVPAPGFYPADLTYHGGAVLKSLESHNLYLNRPSAHWGNPGRFLRDLGKSTFVHTIDQYIDDTAGNRYIVGGGGTIPYKISSPLGDSDLIQIVHAAASLFGTGYGHIYHVFLPKGVDFCEGEICYSPDNPPTFVFCAFHGSVQFSDIGHVVFSLEPYANVDGCSIEQPSPNGALRDSVDSILSHELFEAITDPDGDAWWAEKSLGTFGQEIGDLCAGVDPVAPFFKDPISKLNGTEYEIQLEYSNIYHACANAP